MPGSTNSSLDPAIFLRNVQMYQYPPFYDTHASQITQIFVLNNKMNLENNVLKRTILYAEYSGLYNTLIIFFV